MLSLSPDWRALASAIGGGPLLVKNGKPVFHANESFRPAQPERPAAARRDRPASRRADRPRRRRGNEAGIQHRHVELRARSRALAPRRDDRIRARRGIRRGNGVRRQAAHPPVGRHPGEALRRARPLVQRRLRRASLRCRALAERRRHRRHARRSPTVSCVLRTWSRRSTARAARRSPSRTARCRRALHALAWNGTMGGSPATEGSWTFTVTGTDDRNITTMPSGRSRSTTRSRRSPSRSGAGGWPTATFRLTRSAKVVVQIQRLNGVPVATLDSGSGRQGRST